MMLRVSFDVGGVVSRNPHVYIPMIRALDASPEVKVFVLTDMDWALARELLDANGLGFVPDHRLLSADWTAHGERCKSVLIKEYGINLHVDDLPAYTMGDSVVGLLQMPGTLPYDSPDWVTEKT